MSAALVPCPGCGAVFPDDDLPPERRLNASGACWAQHGEVVGFELQDLSLVRDLHQLTVDAYGAQHAGGPTRPITIAYALVGLHLALDLGIPGVRVREAHSRMGKPDGSWPSFPRPASTGSLTVVDVARAGAWAGSSSGHRSLVLAWAADVWDAWAPVHADVAALSLRLLGPLGLLRP